MNKSLSIIFSLVAIVICFAACKDEETYAEQKEKERKSIASFLKRDVAILDASGDTICKVGKIQAISESQFYAQDSVTDLEKNQYVCFSKNGVYMQIIRKGVGEKIADGETKRIICSFFEYNILADSLLLRNDGHVNYWKTNPDIMNVKNTSGTYTATFDTSVNGGGAMYLTYASTAVPNGWLTPLPFINVGRQISPEGIAKVRLIVPHSEGTSTASGNVYPTFYEISFQEMRE